VLFRSHIRAVHVFNYKTGLFDLSVTDAEAMKQEAKEAVDIKLEDVRLPAIANMLFIAGCLHKGDVAQVVSPLAERLWSSVNKAESPLKLPASTFGTMTTFLAATGRLPQALEVFKKMKESKLQIEEVVYNTLIREYCRSADHKQALEVFSDAKTAGVIPSPFTYTTLLMAIFNSGDLEGARACAQEMQFRDIQPTLDKSEAAKWDQVYKGLFGEAAQ